MAIKIGDELRAGAFIAAGVILTALIVFVLGKERQIFADQEEFITNFKDVKGLAVGAPVRLGGITVGRVSRIGFGENITDPTIHVRFLINEQFLDRLSLDSLATIETQGLLGDRFVSIVRGKDKKLLPPGGAMRSMEAAEIAEIVNKAARVVDNSVEISTNVNEFFKTLRADVLDNFNDAIKSVANLSREIEKGDGLIHRLVYSKKDGDEIMGNLREVSDNLSKVVKDVKEGQGALHSLIYDPAGGELVKSLTSAAGSLSATAASLEEVLNEVKSGDGIMHEIIYSKSDGGLDEVIAKLHMTAENLKKASEALAHGTGTLGALLVDPQLYDNLVEVTDEAKRSFLLRQAIRSSLDK